jgi:hypothetical protein
MNKMRNPIAMLIAGTFAGFLSGLMTPLVFGLRGAAFGLALSLTVILVGRSGWKSILPYLPGLVLGIGLGFFRYDLDLGGHSEPATYDFLTLLNAVLCIPLLAYAYLTDPLKKRIGLLLLFGVLSCLFRSWTFDSDWRAAAFVVYNFPIGMLPFLLLWMLAMQLTDPRFICEHNKTPKEERS